MSNPTDHDLFRHGLSLFKSGKYQEASEIFHQIVNHDEEEHRAWNALGVCLSKTGDRENAKTCFENAHTLDPDNATYIKNLEKLTPKDKPIRKKTPKPITKPVPKKKGQKRPITDYIMATGGFLVFLFVILLLIALIISPHAPTKTPVQPVQTIIPTTTIPTAIITPSETHASSSVTDLIPPSHVVQDTSHVVVPTVTATPTPVTPTEIDIQLFDTVDEGAKDISQKFELLFEKWDYYDLGYQADTDSYDPGSLQYYWDMQEILLDIKNTANLYRTTIKGYSISLKYCNYRDEVDDAFRKIAASALHFSQMLEESNPKDRKSLKNQAKGEMAAMNNYFIKATIEMQKII